MDGQTPPSRGADDDGAHGGMESRAHGGMESRAHGGTASETREMGETRGSRATVSDATRSVPRWSSPGDVAAATSDGRTAAEHAAQLRRLHEATREMMARETKPVIADVATDAAADILGFELNSVRLYDDEAEQLRPVAAASKSVAIGGERRVYERGETVQWAALDDDEMKVYQDVSALEDDVSRPKGGSMLVLPLGDLGLLTLGSQETNDIDEADIEIARVLAANLETALERADRIQLLKQRERTLESKTERLDRFASLVAHEFRNPLAIAEGHLDLCTAREGSEKHVRAARDAVDRMDRLTESILDLTNEHGVTDPTNEVSVGYVARSVWESHAPGPATLECDEEITVSANRARLRTMFENLFDNAIGIGGPEVTVRVEERADEPGFVVEDDGPGFDADDPTELFQYGATVENAGTGLGLALVRDIAEAHGWEIEVSSSPGEGARFVFRTESA
jgi:signal transduction histidine kinase